MNDNNHGEADQKAETAAIPSLSRTSALLLAALLAIVGGFGLLRIPHEYPSQWARILPEVIDSPAADLKRAMKRLGDETGG